MHKFWRGLINLALAVFALASIPWASLPAAEMKVHHLSVGGFDREYFISVAGITEPTPDGPCAPRHVAKCADHDPNDGS
jgi:hypothetical protein